MADWYLTGGIGQAGSPFDNMLQGIGFPLREVEQGGGAVVERGKIVVTSNAGVSGYLAVADGVADDRSVLLAALTEAAANMPSVVQFGPGDYGIFGGMEVQPPQGAWGLSLIGNNTRIVFNGPSALTATQYIAIDIEPSVTPVVGQYDNYLANINVTGITFRDNDPLLHQNPAGPEESHGLSVKYARDVHVSNCDCEKIGDEGVNFQNIIGGEIEYCRTTETPSIGISGGALSVGGGCRDVVVFANKLYGSATVGVRSTISGSVGVDMSVVATATMSKIENVKIDSNSIFDFEEAGVQMNCADTTNASDIEGVSVTNNTVRNTKTGVLRRGEQGISYGIGVLGNSLADLDNAGVGFDVGETFNIGASVSFNKITNVSGGTGTIAGVLCNGTGLNLSGNDISNVIGYGIYAFFGDEIVVNGGIISNCGTTSVQNIRQQTDSKSTLIEGVKIVNAASTTSVIVGCAEVNNCEIHQTVPFWAQISVAKRVTGNVMNGGIRTTGDGAIITDNYIKTALNIGGDGIELVGQQDCIVSHNYVEVSFANRVGIDADNACDYTIFNGNNTRNSSITGRAFLTTNASIIQANNQPAFTDKG